MQPTMQPTIHTQSPTKSPSRSPAKLLLPLKSDSTEYLVLKESTNGAASTKSNKNGKLSVSSPSLHLSKSTPDLHAFPAADEQLSAEVANGVLRQLQRMLESGSHGETSQQQRQAIVETLRRCIFSCSNSMDIPYFQLYAEQTAARTQDKRSSCISQGNFQFIIADLKQQLNQYSNSLNNARELSETLKIERVEMYQRENDLKKEIKTLQEELLTLKLHLENQTGECNILYSELEKMRMKDIEMKPKLLEASRLKEDFDRERTKMLLAIDAYQTQLMELTQSYRKILEHYKLAQVINERLNSKVSASDREKPTPLNLSFEEIEMVVDFEKDFKRRRNEVISMTVGDVKGALASSKDNLILQKPKDLNSNNPNELKSNRVILPQILKTSAVETVLNSPPDYAKLVESSVDLLQKAQMQELSQLWKTFYSEPKPEPPPASVATKPNKRLIVKTSLLG
eukprot:GILJ01011529.1.p1 GENE.GILJ01011529.1~~GILJ01011529.1.p1  ORF type:complete len:455 (-),score=80.22 GILJ01011529.1:205-1569(-)